MNTDNPESQGDLPQKAPLKNLSPQAFILLSLAAVFFLYQIIGGTFAYMLAGDDLDTGGKNVGLIRVVLSFGQFMFILAPAIVLVMLKGDNLRETFRLTKPQPLVLILSLAGIIVVQPFLQSLIYFQNELLFSIPGTDAMKSLKDIFDSLEQTTLGLVKADSFPEFLLVLFVIAVTPAISEEFLFRGLVFFNFEKVYSPVKAMVLTGTIFALFHFHPFNLVPLIVLGVFLTFSAYASGSIYTAVACHFLNNFISAAAVYIYGTESFGSESMTSDEKVSFALAGIGSLALFIIVVRMMRKFSNPPSAENL